LRWKTHIKILKLVLQYLNINIDKEFLRGLFRGIVDPDIRHDIDIKNRKIVKQHSENVKKLIKYYTQLSIHLYLRGRREDAGISLGRAIHYAHDMLLKTRKYLILDIHDKIEYEIDRECNNVDMRFVKECIEKSSIKKSNDPYKVLCSSIKMTYVILKYFIDNVFYRKWLRYVIYTTCIYSMYIVICLTFLKSIIFTIPVVSAIFLILVMLKIRFILFKPRLKNIKTVI